MPLFATFLLGIAAGLRSMSAPAAAVTAARSRNSAGGSSPKLIGNMDATTLFALIAIAEMVADKLPFMPDRKSPPAFAWRVLSGAVSAAAVTAGESVFPLAIIVGGVGAAAGTVGGSAMRSKLAEAFGRDFPAAVIEDAVVLALAAMATKALESPKAASPVVVQQGPAIV
ncbi:DUF4126 family protein [Occallatibacter riparius]|uniref:DUF4126 family protein n=1 Tax=Occallatibacter riparius TaxID=1002689 RepID=A0A9J7BIE7_9BACT|nr:DUF4126 family protein [Occallatibacter riparius]UWZ82568.1 DUF4126 family protein [Occallatibacter riparius]